MPEIELTRGYKTIVDDEDFVRWSCLKWTARGYAYNVHAVHWFRDAEKKVRALALSRLIMSAPRKLLVDHINGNPLDNRRCNLRLATISENRRNGRQRQDRALPKGVCYYGNTSKFLVNIKVNGKPLRLGPFATVLEASRAYDAAAQEHYGEFACLNAL